VKALKSNYLSAFRNRFERKNVVLSGEIGSGQEAVLKFFSSTFSGTEIIYFDRRNPDPHTQSYDVESPEILKNKLVIFIRPNMSRDLKQVLTALERAESTWIIMDGDINSLRNKIAEYDKAIPGSTKRFIKLIDYVYVSSINHGLRLKRYSIKQSTVARLFDLLFTK